MNKNTNLKNCVSRTGLRNFSLKTLIIIFMLQPTTACAFDTFDMYKDTIHELNRDPKSRTLKGNENNVDDLERCPALIKIGRWEESGRSEDWRDGSIINSTGVGLVQRNQGTPEILKSEGKKIFKIFDSRSGVINKTNDEEYFNKKIKGAWYDVEYLIYIGPWKKVTINYPKNFLEKQKKQEKEIRFYAYQYFGSQILGGGNISEHGGIRYGYEEATKENKTIKEKPFSLSPQAKIAPDKFSLCAVKWTARFGYNAIAEVKSKNPFSKNYLVPTGKVIQAEE